MYRVQIIDHNPSKMHLFSRDLRVAGLLFSQPVFWGRGLPRCYLGNPVWAELPFPLWRGMGSVGTSVLGLLFSGGFPRLFRQSEQKRPFPTLCLRAERSQFVLQ